MVKWVFGRNGEGQAGEHGAIEIAWKSFAGPKTENAPLSSNEKNFCYRRFLHCRFLVRENSLIPMHRVRSTFRDETEGMLFWRERKWSIVTWHTHNHAVVKWRKHVTSEISFLLKLNCYLFPFFWYFFNSVCMCDFVILKHIFRIRYFLFKSHLTSFR